MRIAIVAIVAALMSSCARAAPIPSSASGVYIGPDRVCRVVLSRWATHWVQLDLACVPWVGQPTYSLTTLYAPAACPTETVAWAINPWPVFVVREYLSIREILPDRLRVVTGFDPTAVSNGIGTEAEWLLVQPLPSPVPYSCGAAVGNRGQ